ncbi:LLM class flavin-dependent oxidoreductase [Amycolatopsis sp. CA-126428]|uniref:LLM class flavin-dependent oxidoreductase n=1 Tax=Amycolatopsis sp. CA-126428 TaxID=2073158 RepID=UPI0018EC6DCC|nr:LLM class flavin-dependent oxidoreductase [Amycolatopsis sp. CA-126428]
MITVGGIEFLWYIPNQAEPGHRGDDVVADHNSLDTLTAHAHALERHGWAGALLGTGWGRPDTFTVATALAARTSAFQPLVAVRPGYSRPAQFAAAAATLDHLSGGRLLVNVVSGKDDLSAYGDDEGDQTRRYARTKEFLQLVRRLWAEENVTYEGEYFGVTGSTLAQRPVTRPGRPHPRLYFGGASAAAEEVGATEADVQLFWGEPLDGVAERIERLEDLSAKLGREHPPLEYGLRVTTFVRDTTEQAWAEAEAKVDRMARGTIVRETSRGPRPPASDGCSTWPREATCSTTTSTPLLAGSAPPVRARPGLSDRPRTSRSPCASTERSGSATSSCPTPLICRRSSGRAISCCRCCGAELSGSSVRRAVRRTAPGRRGRG